MTRAEKSLKRQVPTILATDPAAEAGRKVLAGQVRRMRRQEAGSRTGEDIESVHRMRVAIRRMRSLLRLLRGFYQGGTAGKIEEGLRDIARALGRIRDLDVLIIDLESLLGNPAAGAASADSVGHRPARSPPRQPPQTAERALRFQRLRALPASVESLRQGAWTGRASIQAPQRAAAIAPRFAPPAAPAHGAGQSLRCCPARQATSNDLHELRVEVKQLRYAVEFFAAGSWFIRRRLFGVNEGHAGLPRAHPGYLRLHRDRQPLEKADAGTSRGARRVLRNAPSRAKSTARAV